MNPRLAIAILVLSVAALASWYVARQQGAGAPAVAVPEAAHRGYYLEDARILGTDASGALLYEIRAEYAEQQADERIRFSSVTIEYTPASDIPWSISADSAVLAPDENRVLLEGNVRARSENGFSGDETEILAPSLSLDPDRYVAETEDRIQIVIGDRNLSGTGMLASLKDSRVEIRSNVSGRFIP